MTSTKLAPRPTLLNLSIEQENLASIPFAILERRVGKRIGKIEIKGVKILPDGSQMKVVWQVQGNNELGLPTEQDLDIFVALGVLTYRNNFAKTVTFTGREVAELLNLSTVHGKFYQRLKLAMDRFIPLRFRALTATDHQEEVKWLNVFQEFSFFVDRSTGRLTGSVTWTDKLIRAMDSGFFRVLDAGRYMELDGITAKHLYRFLVLAFETTDVVLIDARQLATAHLGILTTPKYFSRLMQTLEPAFDQLIKIQALGSYNVVSAADWKIALRRHPSYTPAGKLLEEAAASEEFTRSYCQRQLENAGFAPKFTASVCEKLSGRQDLYGAQRAAQLVEEMCKLEVLPHVALGLVRRALELGPGQGEGREMLDWCAIAVEVCQHKRKSGQTLKNLPGLLVKIVRDPETRRRAAPPQIAEPALQRYREMERGALRRQEDADERDLLLEYEQFRQELARQIYAEMPERTRQALRRQKAGQPEHQRRLEKVPPALRDTETDQLILQDLAEQEAPPYPKWRLRMKAQQAMLPFGLPRTEAAPVSGAGSVFRAG